MTLDFIKMNGAGNDFVMLDNRDLQICLTSRQIAHLCDRHRGVGADGLLMAEPAEKGADFRMRYYNADGGEAEMCGNGARCFGRYINRLHDNTLSQVTFETPAGLIQAELIGESVRINMSAPFDLKLDQTLDVGGERLKVHSINTGVPHAVTFFPDIDSVDVCRLGSALRHHAAFSPKGTNANFVQVLAPDSIRIRTFERGVEDETLACGTGMVACVLVHHALHAVPSPVQVLVQGGDLLEVGFTSLANGNYQDVSLFGPADFVFDGTIQL